jgi:hypothetical protein
LASRSQIAAALSGVVWDSLVLELPYQFVSGRAWYPGFAEGQTVPSVHRAVKRTYYFIQQGIESERLNGASKAGKPELG